MDLAEIKKQAALELFDMLIKTMHDMASEARSKVSEHPEWSIVATTYDACADLITISRNKYATL